MKIVIPAPPNFALTDSKNEIQVKVRTDKVSPFLRLLVIVVSFFWILMGAWLAFVIVAMGGPASDQSLTVASFSFWVGLGALLLSVFVFYLTFQETVTVSHEAIQIESSSWLSRKRSYQYLAKHIQGLRISPLPPFFSSGRIVFDYGGKTVYFGNKLNESEARHILSLVQTKFADYDFAN
jgi:hypothetical protein